jgi:hypothetical protein
MCEYKIKTSKNALSKSMMSCMAIFCLLAVSVFVLLSNMSLGWFASNDSVDAGKMHVSIKDIEIEIAYYYKTAKMDDYSEMTSPEQMIEGLMPGDVVSIKVEYTNNDSRSFTLMPYLDYEDGFETPLVYDELYYYLSSQLMVNDTPLLDGAVDGMYFTEEQIPTDIYFDHIEDLSPGETEILEFTITFVNLDKDQNIYQDFKSKCIRVIHTDYTVNE